jgi:hypothetical protein
MKDLFEASLVLVNNFLLFVNALNECNRLLTFTREHAIALVG